jgi:hypothetical protein
MDALRVRSWSRRPLTSREDWRSLRLRRWADDNHAHHEHASRPVCLLVRPGDFYGRPY